MQLHTGSKFEFLFKNYFCCFSDVPASAMYFGSYEIIQRALVPEGGDRTEIGIGRTIFAGGMAGIFNWIVALPPDVVKSRLQSGNIINCKHSQLYYFDLTCLIYSFKGINVSKNMCLQTPNYGLKSKSITIFGQF